MRQQYKDGGIWTMETTRQSCVIPEYPLLINEQEERELNQLSLAVWRANEAMIGWANEGISELGRTAIRYANAFPEGLTMPPAIRVDVVRTADGPKIVEIDPISALSLGETLFLGETWKSEGFAVPTGLVEAIESEVGNRALVIELPKQKAEYTNEVNYLRRALGNCGMYLASGDDSSAVRLSSFSELAASRKELNKDGWVGKENPLWGSLYGMAGKSNLDGLISTDKQRLMKFMPQQYTRDVLSELDAEAMVVVKPEYGTGSAGVGVYTAKQAGALQGQWVCQELLAPLVDDFGVPGEWVSRVSIYAGRTGMLGAQVTARLIEGAFTNVHGQSDAIQTTLAIQ